MIVFGLGNPGLRYRSTRHNAGYIFVEQLAKYYKKRFSIRKNCKIAKLKIKRTEMVLIKPKCWMNQCGCTIREILGGEECEFIVVLDDINLPLGKIRLRSKGSDGGHLGLRSIIDMLETSAFPRLRIGIGLPHVDAADYVLSRFSATERKLLMKVIKEGITGMRIMLNEGFVKAQNYINSINIKDVD
jgi:PTH1 family peptidyl-tRNA hydrolase